MSYPPANGNFKVFKNFKKCETKFRGDKNEN